MVGQVADFGLSRGATLKAPEEGADADDNSDGDDGEYYRSQSGVFPIRWTSPEAMESLKFTFASDVWSFAIVMVEIYQDGIKPYHDFNNSTVMTKVMGGYKHPQPPGCTSAVYEMLCECWEPLPKNRPHFGRIVEVLEFNYKKRQTSNDAEEQVKRITGGTAGKRGSMINHSASSQMSGSSGGGSGMGGISADVLVEEADNYAEGGVPHPRQESENDYTDMGFGGGAVEVVKGLEKVAFHDEDESTHSGPGGIVGGLEGVGNPMYKAAQKAMTSEFGFEDGNDGGDAFDATAGVVVSAAAAKPQKQLSNRKTSTGSIYALPDAPMQARAISAVSSEGDYIVPNKLNNAPEQPPSDNGGYIDVFDSAAAPPVAARSASQKVGKGKGRKASGGPPTAAAGAAGKGKKKNSKRAQHKQASKKKK